jgi:hypothetical protein
MMARVTPSFLGRRPTTRFQSGFSVTIFSQICPSVSPAEGLEELRGLGLVADRPCEILHGTLETGLDEAIEHLGVLLAKLEPLLDRLRPAPKERATSGIAETELTVDGCDTGQFQEIVGPEQELRIQILAIPAVDEQHRLPDVAEVLVVERDLAAIEHRIALPGLHEHERSEHDLEVTVFLAERIRGPAGRELVVHLPDLGNLAIHPGGDLGEESGRSVLSNDLAVLLDLLVRAHHTPADLVRLLADPRQLVDHLLTVLLLVGHGHPADADRVLGVGGYQARSVVSHVVGPLVQERLEDLLRRT